MEMLFNTFIDIDFDGNKWQPLKISLPLSGDERELNN